MSEFKLPEEFIKNSRALHIQSVRTATSIGLLVMQGRRLGWSIAENQQIATTNATRNQRGQIMTGVITSKGNTNGYDTCAFKCYLCNWL